MSLPQSLAQLIKQATVLPDTIQSGENIDDRLEIYYDIRSWLESFDRLLHDHKWRSATNALCMLGVDWADRPLVLGEYRDTFNDPTLVWLSQNQEVHNGLVAQILADHRHGLAAIKAYVRADIRRLKAHQPPEIFAILPYAERMLVWLEQV